MSVGYPDYSRTQAQAGNQLGSFFGQKGNDPATGRMDCIGYAYLTVGIDDANNVHNYTVVVTFYDDFGLTNIIGTRQLVPVPGQRFPYQVPVISRYAVATCSHIVFGDTEVIGCIVYGSNIPVKNIGDSQGGQPFLSSNSSVAAGATVTVPALFTYDGLAILSAGTSSGTAFFVQINYYSLLTASFVQMVVLTGAGSGSDFTAQIALPPCPVNMVLHNSDTVARTLFGTVVLA